MPATPRKQQLTRDQNIQIHAFRSIGMTYEAIAKHMGITQRQVQLTSTREHVTPSKRSGRPSTLSQEQQDELIEYVCHSKLSRRLSYLHLSLAFESWNVSEYAIRTCLRNAGFKRYIARAKPPLSEKNIRARKAWAHDHINWTKEQWHTILWTDETWVTGGRHTRTWVTRRQGEELDPTCIVEKVRKKKGWMFWGCFSGSTKGPSLFWEKEWGSINIESYSARVVPLIDGWFRLNPQLQVMQDGAPGHTGGNTKMELQERGIPTIFWPAFSPDLNPIEIVWNKMKDYIALNFPEKLSYDQLRAAVKESWEEITPEFL